MLVSLFPGVALLLGASAALLLLVLSHASPVDELDFPFFDSLFKTSFIGQIPWIYCIY